MIRLCPVSLPAFGGAREALIRAAVRDAVGDLVVLPECSFGGYRHLRAEESAGAERLARSIADTSGKALAIGFLNGPGNAVGLATPGGAWQVYQKRFPSPREAVVWDRGAAPGIFDTRWGKLGVAICADVLHMQVWRDLQAANVVAVIVAGAWPSYDTRAPPGLSWLWRDSNAYRDTLLQQGANALGVPVAFSNAAGPSPAGSLSGGAAVFEPNAPGSLEHFGHWRWFVPAYDTLGRISGAAASAARGMVDQQKSG